MFLHKQASLCTANQPTLITICTMNNCHIYYKKSYSMTRRYIALAVASISIEIAVAY